MGSHIVLDVVTLYKHQQEFQLFDIVPKHHNGISITSPRFEIVT